MSIQEGCVLQKKKRGYIKVEAKKKGDDSPTQGSNTWLDQSRIRRKIFAK